MIELRHMDVRHFVIIECTQLANGCTIKHASVQTWLHQFDVILLSIMSASNNIRYKYYRICFGI